MKFENSHFGTWNMLLQKNGIKEQIYKTVKNTWKKFGWGW